MATVVVVATAINAFPWIRDQKHSQPNKQQHQRIFTQTNSNAMQSNNNRKNGGEKRESKWHCEVTLCFFLATFCFFFFILPLLPAGMIQTIHFASTTDGCQMFLKFYFSFMQSTSFNIQMHQSHAHTNKINLVGRWGNVFPSHIHADVYNILFFLLVCAFSLR